MSFDLLALSFSLCLFYLLLHLYLISFSSSAHSLLHLVGREWGYRRLQLTSSPLVISEEREDAKIPEKISDWPSLATCVTWKESSNEKLPTTKKGVQRGCSPKGGGFCYQKRRKWCWADTNNMESLDSQGFPTRELGSFQCEIAEEESIEEREEKDVRGVRNRRWGERGKVSGRGKG